MSDFDLTQYNGTPSYPAPADVGTAADPLLVPTDGTYITADSNLTQEGPVNRSIKRLKDLYLGLRGAIMGDVPGVQSRSIRSLIVSTTPGVVHGNPPGTVQIGGNGVTANEVLVVSQGKVKVGNGDLQIFNDVKTDASLIVGKPGVTETQAAKSSGLKFTSVSTLVTGANPPQGTPLKNELRAINIPKVSGLIAFNAGTITVVPGSGYGLGGASVNTGTPFGLDVFFTDNFANTNYVMTWSCPDLLLVVESFSSRTVNKMILRLTDPATGANTNFTTYTGWLNIQVDGMQTT